MTQDTPWWRSRLTAVLAAIFCLLIVVSFLMSVFVRTVMSLSWVALISGWVPVSVIASMLLGGAVIFVAPVRPKRPVVTLVAALMFGAFSGSLLLLHTIPALVAVLVGQRAGIVQIVRSLPERRGKCRNPVELATGELICDLSDEVRSRLTPGMEIIVIGRGTWIGVIPDHVEPVDRSKLVKAPPF